MFFFFNDTATTEIYTLSLHDALPIFGNDRSRIRYRQRFPEQDAAVLALQVETVLQVESNDDRHDEILRYGLQPDHEREERSEEHTSELQSQSNLVCRLLLEKTKTQR